MVDVEEPEDLEGPEEGTPGSTGKKPDAAKRALAEALARRVEREAKIAAMPREIGGRGGNEPVRYGDWEVKGLASDF